jgi:hypothetical protein
MKQLELPANFTLKLSERLIRLIMQYSFREIYIPLRPQMEYVYEHL